MVTQKNLYDNAVRVIDEDGKGAESLRSVSTEVTGTNDEILLIAEVDSILRSVYITPAANISGGGQSITVLRHRNGGNTGVTMCSVTLPNPTGSYSVVEGTITVSDIQKGDVIRVLSAGNVAKFVQVGWMPNIFGSEAEYRTY